MGLMKHNKTEGGQGGKRGHSNMCHWVTTEEIKEATRRNRREEAKEMIAEEKSEMNAAEPLNETEYLMRSPANARRLLKSICESEQGSLITKTFAELGIE
jgi:PHD/YefM family antitoxin component YafN of YafNO toxin-antitoxin module